LIERGMVFLVKIVVACWFRPGALLPPSAAMTEKDTIVLADFENKKRRL
jgi:hypothetical protein